MVRSLLYVMLLASAFCLVNCTEPPPLPPGGDNGSKPTDTKLPGDDNGPPPTTLNRVGESTLPRQALAVFLNGDTSFSCTPDGSLYDKKIEDLRSFELTATDLVSGKKLWSYKGSSCAFRVDGDSVMVAKYQKDVKDQLHFDRLDLKTGKILNSVQLRHSGCAGIQISGDGEKLFATSSSQGYSCYDFSVADGKLLVTSEAALRLVDATSGKLLWERKNDDNVKRFASAHLQDGVVYAMEAVKELDGSANKLADSATDAQYERSYQLRAIDANGQSKWVAGPFQPHLVSARSTFVNGAVIVQALNATSDLSKGADHVGAIYGSETWTGYIRYYSLNAKSGQSNWEQVSKLYVNHTKLTSTTLDQAGNKTSWKIPTPALSAPIAMQGGLVVQAPGILQQINPENGHFVWSAGLQTNDLMVSHVHAISSEHLHLRSSDSKVTLLRLIPKKAPEITRGGEVGSLLYAADGIAPDNSGKASQGPKKRFSARGYCLKFNGDPVPMSQIRNGTRFFLPPANNYYTPASFFTAFCANYLIDVEAFDLSKPNEAALWKSRALVPEAPVFYFVRGSTLYVLSDNGDWYFFSLR